MQPWLRWIAVGTAFACLHLGWTWMDRRSADAAWVRRSIAPGIPPEYADRSAVRIVQFYAASPAITEGDSTVLCYGVINAGAVRIEPPVERLSPSFNRCIQVAPETNTRYTLHVTGRDGKTTVEASVHLRVDPNPALAPQIVRVWTKWVKPDRFGLQAHCLCFQSRNTTTIQVDPPAFPAYSGVTGCFYVVPNETTTYTFIGKDGKGREARKTYTIEVPARTGSGAATMALAGIFVQL